MGPVPRVAAFVATYADAYVWPQKGSIYCPMRALARFRRQSLRGAAFLGGGRASGRAGQFEGPVPALRTDLTSALLGEAVRTASSALLAEELHRFVPSAGEAVGEKTLALLAETLHKFSLFWSSCHSGTDIRSSSRISGGPDDRLL
jgi:hypothetical protein